MRIALIIDTWLPYIGGGQINAWEISKRIARKNVKIDIITRNSGVFNLQIPKNLRIIKLGPRSQPHNMFSKLTFLTRAFIYLQNKQYDLVHIHAFLPGIIVPFIRFTKNTPVIFTIHGTSIGTKLLKPFRRYIEKFILTQISYSAQITVSRDFLKIKNINRKIFYIPNGINIEDFDKTKPVKFKAPTLIFVGRLHPQKNLPVLIQCINTLKQKFPQIQLLIIGKGPEKSKIVALVKKLKLTENVKFFGEITGTKLIKLYKSSHIFALPSIYEGQPLTLLEAWAAKLPVIVSKTGDCQYLVKNGVNGYLINNPQDSDEIARLIKKAIESDKLEKMRLNGYNFVKNNFSWEKSAEQTLRVYENVSRA